MVKNEPQLSIPTLHHLSSSQSLRVLWALEELAANGFQYKLENYKRVGGAAPPELKAIFPLGKSPIMTIEPLESKANGEREVLTESRLILQYISDHYSNGIWDPTTPEDMKRNTFFQEYANNTLLHKVDFALVFDVIPPNLPALIRPLGRAMVKPMVSHFTEDQQAIYQYLEDALTEEKPWCAGEKLGLADFCMSWPMDLATARGYFDEKKFPKLAIWHGKIKERPAYKRALEKGGSYELVTFDM